MKKYTRNISFFVKTTDWVKFNKICDNEDKSYSKVMRSLLLDYLFKYDENGNKKEK